MPWKKMRLRDATVLARVNDAGEPLAQGGRVEVRYNAKSPKAYRAAAANLAPVVGAEVLPDDHCVAAEPEGAPAASPSSSSRAKAGSTTRAGAAVKGSQPAPVAAGTVIVYADGACSGNPGPSALGLVVIDGPVRIERSEFLGQGTNNTAELTAVMRALEAVDDPKKPVAIHTDSLYAIGVLSKGWKAKANQELIAEVRGLLRGRPLVEFVHVRGHSGVILNERADELARQAIADRRTVEKVYGPTGPAASPRA